MFTNNAKEIIEEYINRSYRKNKIKINNRIWCYVGWGLCNTTVIEGNNSVILVDTPDSDARAERLLDDINKHIGKPVKYIIFTHSHRDHTGGAGVFSHTQPEVIVYGGDSTTYKHTDKIGNVLRQRMIRQFGYTLSNEEYITQGVGLSDSNAVGDGKFNFIKPTKILTDDKTSFEIDGVKIELMSAPGETDDHMYVWLSDDKVLCCGDNYYGCFPNLYAIRGGQYRDIAQWIDSTRKILDFPALALLPGHTNPLLGEHTIKNTIAIYADAMESILLQTLDCMDKGMSLSQTVKSVKLDKKYADSVFSGEFYGTLEWSVRSIYTAYLGWFDGNPTNLFPVSDNEFAAEILKLTGKDILTKAVYDNFSNGKYQMAIQLAELVINACNDCNCEEITNEDIKQMKKLKASAFIKLGETQTSLNGRHYYLTCANEILKEI